jgi:hypothetical protein
VPRAARAWMRTRRSNRNILTDPATRRQIDVMTSLLWLFFGTVALAAGLGLVLYLPELLDGAERLRRRWGVAVAPEPEGPAIEDVARSLRRLRPQVLMPAPGTPMARRTATLAAYDDVLLEATRALDLPDTLSGLPPGTDRDAERLRVEHLLEQAGLRLG